MYTAINCVEVTKASLCEGLHNRYDCFPASQAPGYLVALVIALAQALLISTGIAKCEKDFGATNRARQRFGIQITAA